MYNSNAVDKSQILTQQFLHSYCMDRRLAMCWDDRCGHHCRRPCQFSHTLCTILLTCSTITSLHHHYTPSVTGSTFRRRQRELPQKRNPSCEILRRTDFQMSLCLHFKLSVEYHLSDRCLRHVFHVRPTGSATSDRKTRWLFNANC
jgi:hypothetical protein